MLYADRGAAWPDVRFVLEQVFGADVAPEDAILSSVMDFAVADDGRVFVVDRRGAAIVAFDSDGRVLWRQSRRGDGPGDVREPTAIGLGGGGDRLYVSNQGGTRIDTWSTGGEFLEAHPAGDFGKAVVHVAGFRAPAFLFVWSPRYGEAALDARVINVATWETEADFVIRSELGYALEPNVNLAPPLRVTGDRVFAGGDGQYVLRELDWGGNLQRAVSGDSDLLAAPTTSSSRVASAGTGYVWPPIVLPDGSWLTTGRWVTNKQDLEDIFRREASALARRHLIESAYFLDLFTPDGALAGRLIWEGERPAWAFFDQVDVNGRVYSGMDEPFPQIRRYRIEGSVE